MKPYLPLIIFLAALPAHAQEKKPGHPLSIAQELDFGRDFREVPAPFLPGSVDPTCGGQLDKTQIKQRKFGLLNLDLNGDKKEELLVRYPVPDKGGRFVAIYSQTGEGGLKEIAFFQAARLFLLEPKGGYHRLEVWEKAKDEKSPQVWSFQNGRYRKEQA